MWHSRIRECSHSTASLAAHVHVFVMCHHHLSRQVVDRAKMKLRQA